MNDQSIWLHAWDVLKFVLPIIFVFGGWLLKLRSDMEMLKLHSAQREERIRNLEATHSHISQQIQTVTVMLARLEERLDIIIMRDKK